LDKNDQAIADYTQAIPLLDQPPVVAGKNKKLVADMIANASGSVYIDRGALYLRSKQYTKAIADYTKFLAAHKGAARIYLLRAQAYKESGDMKKAAADCKTARTLAPANDKINIAADEILSPASKDEKPEQKIKVISK
jgi:tetratricopeptide (TPR) repeat protein